MALNILDSDSHVNGNLSCVTLSIPDGTIIDADVNATAAIAATKVVHQFPLSVEAFGPTTTVAALEKLLHVARAAGTLVGFEAVVVTPATGADRTVTIALHKGSQGIAFATVLSSNITFDNTHAALQVRTGTISSTSYADGDVFKAVVTVAGAAGNQAIGLLITLFVRENPQ